MKTVKTLTTFMLAALLIFLLAACGGNDDNLNSLKYLKGTVTEITEGTATIQTDDGQSYIFSLEGADLDDASALETGAEAEIVYTGVIDGTDTSNTALVRVIAATTSSTPSSSIPADDGMEHSVTGTILDSDGATLVVRPAGQDAITFNIVGADAGGANGLVIGDEVTVYFTGTLNGTDTSGITVTRVTQDPATTPNANSASQTPEGEKVVSGTILFSDGASLTVKTAEGTEYTFDVVGADATGAKGLVEGDDVTVYYTGQLSGTDTSGVTITRLVQ